MANTNLLGNKLQVSIMHLHAVPHQQYYCGAI